MKKIFSLISVFALVLVIFSQGAFAKEVVVNDKKIEFNQDEKAILKDGFSELGIDKKTQEALIKKLENGDILDSMKSENLQKALNSTNSKMSLNNPQIITFDDGSKLIYGTELVDIGIQPMLASGSYTVRSYWNTIVLNYSFYTDLVIVSGDNNDYIVKSYNPNVSINIPGGTYSNETATVQRKYETSTKRAYSRMDFNYTVPTGSASVDLYFQVGDNDYETTLSLKDAK